MPIRICTRMPMYNWLGIIPLEAVNQCRSNGLGNGDLQSQQRIAGADGEIIAVYVRPDRISYWF